jgi:hypothetical protein
LLYHWEKGSNSQGAILLLVSYEREV